MEVTSMSMMTEEMIEEMTDEEATEEKEREHPCGWINMVHQHEPNTECELKISLLDAVGRI